MKKLTFVAIAILVGLASVLLVRFPGPGRTLHFRGDAAALGTSTVLLLRLNDCLVLSRSESDIGRNGLSELARDRTYQLAIDGNVEILQSGSGLSLTTESRDYVVEVGQPFEGTIVFRPNDSSSIISDFWEYGWPRDKNCGANVAIVSSIERVQPRPQAVREN